MAKRDKLLILILSVLLNYAITINPVGITGDNRICYMATSTIFSLLLML